MCQLTYLHGDPTLAKAFLVNLTISNANSGNRDGHGLFVFPNTIWKTKEDGSSIAGELHYLDTIDKIIPDGEIVSVIAHVRSASRGFPIKDENSHPFRIGNLILAHNGTLEPEKDSDKDSEHIDSYWFLNKLSTIVQNKKLTAQMIAKAMEEFRGKFAFLIHDTLQPNLLFIVKGKADLSYCRIIDNKKEQNLFIINTSKKNIESNVTQTFLRIFYKQWVNIVELKDFDEESIYIYDINTSDLTKTSVKIPERVLTCVYKFYGGSSSCGHFAPQKTFSSGLPSSKITDVSNLCIKMNLTFSELNCMFMYLFGDSLVTCSFENLSAFHDILKSLDKDYYKADSKVNLWKKIKMCHRKETLIVSDIYSKLDLQIPWFLNKKEAMKNVLNSLKERDSDG